MARILDSIDAPDKLKLLTDEELSILAGEIREEIVQVTSKTGGHVASSLGAVEIILAVHSLIDSPKDRPDRLGLGPQLQHLRPEAGGGPLPEGSPQLQAEH